MRPPASVLVVGVSAGGLTTAEALRELVGVLGWNRPKQTRMQRENLLPRLSVP